MADDQVAEAVYVLWIKLGLSVQDTDPKTEMSPDRKLHELVKQWNNILGWTKDTLIQKPQELDDIVSRYTSTSRP